MMVAGVVKSRVRAEGHYDFHARTLPQVPERLHVDGVWPGQVTLRRGWAKAVARPWNDDFADNRPLSPQPNNCGPLDPMGAGNTSLISSDLRTPLYFCGEGQPLKGGQLSMSPAPYAFDAEAKRATLELEWSQPAFKLSWLNAYTTSKSLSQLDLDRTTETTALEYLSHLDLLLSEPSIMRASETGTGKHRGGRAKKAPASRRKADGAQSVPRPEGGARLLHLDRQGDSAHREVDVEFTRWGNATIRLARRARAPEPCRSGVRLTPGRLG